MAIIGKDENSEKWFDPDFPTVKEIRSNLSMKESGNLSYQELVQAVEELKQNEGLRITRRILPEVLETRIYQGVYRKENPDARNVWRYGDRIRIRDAEGNARWSIGKAKEEGFNLHIHTQKSLEKIMNGRQQDKAWTGFHIIAPDYRPIYRPLVFNIRGRSYAWFLKNNKEEVQKKFQGLSYDLKDHGDRSLMKIPSRTKRKIPGRDYIDYIQHDIRVIGLPINKKTEFTNPVRVDMFCDCEWSICDQGYHKRWLKPEQLFCTHAITAIELDKPYREEVSVKVRNAEASFLILEQHIAHTKDDENEMLIKKMKNIELFIEANSGSIPIISDIIYKPGKNIIYFTDILDRKATIKYQGSERNLNEIEREILINQKMLKDVEKEGYVKTLNSNPGDFLIHFLNDPYNFSYNSMLELDSSNLKNRINELYGPE